MADYAPNYTPRYRVKYSSHGKTHRFQFRFGRSTAFSAAIPAKVTAWLNALHTAMWTDFTVLGADWAEVDSDVFLPVEAPAPDAGTVAVGSSTSAAAASHISFVGRTVNGLRAVVFLYGTAIFPDTSTTGLSDFRITNAERADISAATAALSELGGPAYCGNDGATVNWYPYANLKINDHWVRRLRQG